jgi:hypothetical protein
VVFVDTGGYQVIPNWIQDIPYPIRCQPYTLPKRHFAVSMAKTGGKSESRVELPRVAEGLGRRIGAVADLIGSRKAAAAAAGITVGSLQRYIAGINVPGFDVCARLCAAARVRMEWLAFDEGPQFATDAEWAINPRLPTGRGNPHPSQTTQAGAVNLDPGMLATSLRIADEVLKKYGLRDQLSSEQFADIARLVYNDVSRGAAEEVARASLDRILAINRTQ